MLVVKPAWLGLGLGLGLGLPLTLTLTLTRASTHMWRRLQPRSCEGAPTKVVYARSFWSQAWLASIASQRLLTLRDPLALSDESRSRPCNVRQMPPMFITSSLAKSQTCASRPFRPTLAVALTFTRSASAQASRCAA